MNRRKLLRVLPLAAMAGVTVKVGDTAAMAYEMKPDKKYLFVIPGAPARTTAYAAELSTRTIHRVRRIASPSLRLPGKPLLQRQMNQVDDPLFRLLNPRSYSTDARPRSI